MDDFFGEIFPELGHGVEFMNLLTLSELKLAPLPAPIVGLVADGAVRVYLGDVSVCHLCRLHTPVLPFQFHLIQFPQPSYPRDLAYAVCFFCVFLSPPLVNFSLSFRFLI